jgi:preprotein translocase subunit SecA
VLAGAETLRQIEKSIMLQSVDAHWREHLTAMEQLRQGIHLRGYAQKNPKQEYKRESFELFSAMLQQLKHDVLSTLCKLQIQTTTDIEAAEQQRRHQMPQHLVFQHAEMTSMETGSDNAQAVMDDYPKVGRNEPCPCGAGKKYKQCHGKLA